MFMQNLLTYSKLNILEKRVVPFKISDLLQMLFAHMALLDDILLGLAHLVLEKHQMCYSILTRTTR